MDIFSEDMLRPLENPLVMIANNETFKQPLLTMLAEMGFTTIQADDEETLNALSSQYLPAICLRDPWFAHDAYGEAYKRLFPDIFLIIVHSRRDGLPRHHTEERLYIPFNDRGFKNVISTFVMFPDSIRWLHHLRLHSSSEYFAWDASHSIISLIHTHLKQRVQAEQISGDTRLHAYLNSQANSEQTHIRHSAQCIIEVLNYKKSYFNAIARYRQANIFSKSRLRPLDNPVFMVASDLDSLRVDLIDIVREFGFQAIGAGDNETLYSGTMQHNPGICLLDFLFMHDLGEDYKSKFPQTFLVLMMAIHDGLAITHMEASIQKPFSADDLIDIIIPLVLFPNQIITLYPDQLTLAEYNASTRVIIVTAVRVCIELLLETFHKQPDDTSIKDYLAEQAASGQAYIRNSARRMIELLKPQPPESRFFSHW